MSEEKRAIVFDLNKWTNRQMREYRKAMQEGNEAVGYDLLAKVIVSWPFDLPITGESIDNGIGVEDLASIIRAFRQVMEQNFKMGD